MQFAAKDFCLSFGFHHRIAHGHSAACIMLYLAFVRWLVNHMRFSQCIDVDIASRFHIDILQTHLAADGRDIAIGSLVFIPRSEVGMKLRVADLQIIFRTGMIFTLLRSVIREIPMR